MLAVAVVDALEAVPAVVFSVVPAVVAHVLTVAVVVVVVLQVLRVRHRARVVVPLHVVVAVLRDAKGAGVADPNVALHVVADALEVVAAVVVHALVALVVTAGVVVDVRLAILTAITAAVQIAHPQVLLILLQVLSHHHLQVH